MGLQFQSIAPIATFLIAEMGLTYAQLGLLIGLYMFPGAFLSLPGGLLGARFGDRAVLYVALSLLTLGAVIFAKSSSFALALGARLLSGGGAVLLNMQLTKITTDWFAGKEISTAMGILMSMWPLGLGVALATLGGLATATSWQAAIYATAAYTGLALVLIVALYRDTAVGASASGERRPPLWVISNQELALVLIAAVAWMFLNTGFIVFMNFTPALLMERGLSTARAGFFVSWASLILIGSLPLGGYFTDRTRRLDLFIVIGSVASAIACLMVPLWGPPLLWVVFFGLAVGVPTGAVIALPADVLRRESRNTGFGVFYTVYWIGMAFMPPLAGYLLDATGGATVPIWLGGLLWLMILPTLVVFRFLQRRWVNSPSSWWGARGRSAGTPR